MSAGCESSIPPQAQHHGHVLHLWRKRMRS